MYLASNSSAVSLPSGTNDNGNVIGHQSNLKRIRKLQNKAGRVILRCRRRTHISIMHSSLGWLTSQHKIKLHMTLMAGKCLLGVVPSYLRGKFIRAKDFHSYSTRNANGNLFVPRVSCNAAKNLFCYEGAVLFNTLNNPVKTSQSYKEFKDKCKTCLTTLYRVLQQAVLLTAYLVVIPCCILL